MIKVEIVMDEDKLRERGYGVRATYDQLDRLFTERYNLVKEGRFYAEYDPRDSLDDGGMLMAALAQKEWFRETVKVFNWYSNHGHDERVGEFFVNDGIRDLIIPQRERAEKAARGK